MARSNFTARRRSPRRPLFLEQPPIAEGSDYGTIAGFVLWQLGHIPETNEAFEWEGWRFVITALEGHRIETIIVHPAAIAHPAAEQT